jgi:hypothetical protein
MAASREDARMPRPRPEPWTHDWAQRALEDDVREGTARARVRWDCARHRRLPCLFAQPRTRTTCAHCTAHLTRLCQGISGSLLPSPRVRVQQKLSQELLNRPLPFQLRLATSRDLARGRMTIIRNKKIDDSPSIRKPLKPGMAPPLTSYMNPSQAHSLHRVGDATQGWDPVTDALFRLMLLRTRNGNGTPAPVGRACLAFPPPEREGAELRLHPVALKAGCRCTPTKPHLGTRKITDSKSNNGPQPSSAPFPLHLHHTLLSKPPSLLGPCPYRPTSRWGMQGEVPLTLPTQLTSHAQTLVRGLSRHSD